MSQTQTPTHHTHPPEPNTGTVGPFDVTACEYGWFLIYQHAVDELALSGRGLRFVLVDHLRHHHTMTVAQMVTTLAEQGYRLPGRASKVISDSLRWEIARGRVKRVARGVYVYGTAPRTTARRIRLFARACQNWVVAVRRGQVPPPTPQNTRPEPYWVPEDPFRPPWETLYWLWNT